MPQGYAKLTGPQQPFGFRFAGSPFAVVEANVDLSLRWDDTTVETVTQGTRAVLQSDGTTQFFDSLTKTYMIVMLQGLPGTPYLVEEKDYDQLDTFFPDNTWCVIYRATQTLERWQQS